MVDWTKGGDCASGEQCGGLNAKYFVELLLLQHVSRPFSFVETTNTSAWATPPVYVQGLRSSKGQVVILINTKSFEQGVNLVGSGGKTAHVLSGNGPATSTTLPSDGIRLGAFETMFVVWSGDN
jgi:hypothetical protein|eukprot:COSAG02_NODE_3254_length_7085_cov_102.140281_6_plen_124_part_00